MLNSLILYFGGFCLLLFVVVVIGNFSARRLVRELVGAVV